jgi:putative oxidoreductase
MMLTLFSKAEPWSYQLMRIVAGLLFACHGAQKLFGVFDADRVPILTQRGAAGIIEFVGGLLIAAGVAVTPVAFICSGEMAVAFFQSHWPRGFWPIQNGGELAAAAIPLRFAASWLFGDQKPSHEDGEEGRKGRYAAG